MELKDFCMAWAKHDNYKFRMKNSDITAEDLFSERGLMPAIAKRADKICQLVFGYGIGVTFNKYEASTLGEEAVFAESGLPKVILFHIFLYVLQQLSASQLNGYVDVDELLYE